MKTTEQKVLKFIDKKNLLEKNDKVLVALSGGPDSVFLLLLLYKYKKKYNLTIGALHVNHKIRGSDADGDEKYCKGLCTKLDVDFYSIKKDVKSFSNRNKVSLEEAGRIIRYRAFEKIAAAYSYNIIATAHHGSDNVETVLLNLIKGAGLRGLSGIPFKRGKIIRPLLVLSKNEIIVWLNSNQIETRTDKSNLNIEFERNYLRNEIIPRLKEKFNPSLEETFLRTSEIFRLQSELVISLSQDLLINAFSTDSNGLHLDINKLTDVHPALVSALLKQKIDEHFSTEINYDDIQRIDALIKKQRGKKIELTAGIVCFREKGELIFSVNKPKTASEVIRLQIGETVPLVGKRLSIKSIAKNKIDFTDGTEYIDREKISGKSFLLRPWQPGDKFIPLGMRGTKKISDFLTEQKISSAKKKEQLVLINGEQIVWVVGLRIDNRFKLNDETRKVLKLCLF
ncbi:MAG: tRNA lysidine(34) synthetase TilS [Ignavibacteriaceae bacterium]|nr:tRNA lysidine(34) synthetase TilS [Ignavibacteriaceae bacterium]